MTQVGDLLHFTIRDLDTIFGDMLLDVHSLRPAERAEQVLQELEKAQVQCPLVSYSIRILICCKLRLRVQ